MGQIICSPRDSPCCCGISLKKGAKLLAVLLMLKDIFCMSYYSGGMVQDWETVWEATERVDVDDDDKAILSWCLFYGGITMLSLIDFAMAVMLYRGAAYGQISKCQSWFRYGAVVLICCTAMMVNTMLTDMSPMGLLTGSVCFALYGYTTLIVRALKDDLKLEKEAAARIQRFEYVDVNTINDYSGGASANSPFVGNRMMIEEGSSA